MALCWSTSLKTAPTTEPLSLEEAKLQCNVPATLTDEDDLIASLIVAARERVETDTNRALITQTWYWKADGFPCGWTTPIYLPRPPLVSIASISYVDTAGATQTWAESATGYQLVKPSGPKAQYATVQPSYQVIYPVTRYQPEAVTIEYICGYGAATAVPESIKHAMRLLIAHWYLNREAVVSDSGIVTQELPIGVTSLLGGYMVERF